MTPKNSPRKIKKNCKKKKKVLNKTRIKGMTVFKWDILWNRLPVCLDFVGRIETEP
jgi:hypothetical protein